MGILEINGVSKSFGGVMALQNVSLAVEPGKITSLIGPNGAGKTTLFNVTTGIEPVDSGSIVFNGRAANNLKPYDLARLGMLRTFQRSMPFGQLTVLENVLVGRIATSEMGRFGGIWTSRKVKEIFKRDRECVRELLEKVGLSGKEDMLAQNIAYGDQRRLEVARALACKPKILLLDEPVAGMNAEESMEMAQLVKRISKDGLTVFVIEHNLGVVMNLSETIYVLNYGEIIAAGTPDKIQANDRVIEAYLGRKGMWRAVC